MQAMLKQLSPTTVITKFQDIAAASSQVVKTLSLIHISEPTRPY